MGISAKPRLDSDEAQAFTEQARWLHAYHDKRSETIGLRAATVLGFVGLVSALLPPGLVLGKGKIDYTTGVRANVVAVLVLLLLAAGCCLRTLALRKATVPSGEQLREQWTAYARGGVRGLVHAQIAHSYLGGDRDPVGDASKEADSRAKWFKAAVGFLATAIAALVSLTAQIRLLQQV
jgi:hypothetical protein